MTPPSLHRLSNSFQRNPPLALVGFFGAKKGVRPEMRPRIRPRIDPELDLDSLFGLTYSLLSKERIQSQYLAFIVAGWSSPVARQAHNLKAAGSNPAPATNFSFSFKCLKYSAWVTKPCVSLVLS